MKNEALIYTIIIIICLIVCSIIDLFVGNEASAIQTKEIVTLSGNKIVIYNI